MPKSYPQTFKDTSDLPSRQHIAIYRVTLEDGDVYRLAQYDTDIVARVSGADVLFQAFGHKRGPANVHMNLQVDTMDITMPNATLLTEGQEKKLGAFATEGLLDKAKVEIFIFDLDNPTVDAVVHSVWTVQSASSTRTSVTLRCESQVAQIDKESPRTLFQELCNNELYSEWCGVVRATFEVITTFFGLSALFEDAFERPVLTSTWTELHFSAGSVSLDGDDVEVIATASGADKDFAGTADTGSLIYRTGPAVPFVADVDVADWAGITDAGSRHALLVLRESTAADSRMYGIQTAGNNTQLQSLRRNTTGGAAANGITAAVIKSKPLRLRVWYNGTTAWLLYSQDGGGTWSALEAAQMASLALVCLCDEWLSAFSPSTTPGTKYDDYREWTGNVGPKDVLPLLQAAGIVYLNGAQKVDKYYDLGELTIMSGKSNGQKRAVKEHDHISSNLARGRTYVYSEAPTSVVDPELFILTNVVEPFQDPATGEYVRWGAAQADPVDVTVNLGAQYTVEEFIASCGDNIGGGDTTQKPTSIEVFTSPDNVVFTSRGTVLAAAAKLIHGGWFQFRYTLAVTPVASVQYVRFRIDRVASSLTTCTEVQVITHAYQEKLSLLHELPFVPAGGDGAKVAPGCDKRLSTCRDKFNNVAPAGGDGFRGFTTIPRPTDTL